MDRGASLAAYDPSRRRREAGDRRRLTARDFLVHEMSRYCARYGAGGWSPAWSRRLFFLDLDGVFDCGLLGFAHTTVSGPAAVALLHAHGFSVVLNTGRSVEHVRRYCQTYGFEGGVAESGSVLVDAVRQRELALIDARA